MGIEGRDGDPRRASIGWHGRWAAWFLGATGAMGFNLLSNDVGYRGVAATAAVATVFAATGWLRRLPPRAPLIRYGIRALLGLALLAAVASVAVRSPWNGYTTLAAAALTGTSLLIFTDLAAAVRMLGAAALTGAAVVAVDKGGAAMGDGAITAAMTNVGFGLGLFGLGAAVLQENVVLRSLARLAIGAGAVGTGTLSLRNGGDAVLGWAVIIGGIAFAADVPADRGLARAAIPSLSMAAMFVGIGAYSFYRGDTLTGVALMVGGVVPVAYGLARLRTSAPLTGAALLVGGIAIITAGVDYLRKGDLLFGSAIIGGGLAGMGRGLVLLRHESTVPVRFRARLRFLTQESALDTSTGPTPTSNKATSTRPTPGTNRRRAGKRRAARKRSGRPRH